MQTQLKAISTLPPEQPLCEWCGQVRMPVMFAVCTKPVGTVPLCDNQCCPECGGKLELRRTLTKSKHAYWAHTWPLPSRNCIICGKEFTPEHKRKPHENTCSPAHQRLAISRKHYQKNREVFSQSYLDKKAKLA